MTRWFTRFRPAAALEPVTVPCGDLTEVSDEEFLRRFVIDRDERAFAQLVARHGGMVLGVCRRMLGNPQDAEDAFQAVFLILARKAQALRRGGCVPAWLHKTAFRVALRAREARARRREQAAEDLDMLAAVPWSGINSDHERSIVDEELSALPERYRLPLFLCCVEGKSLDAAARQLGWSVGSVKGRLERGRAALRRRLLLRRVPYALAVGLLASGPASASASPLAVASVPPSLIASTAQAGLQWASGRSALGYVSQQALNLAQGKVSIMSLTGTKIAICSLAVLGAAVVGGATLPAPAAQGTGSGEPLVVAAEFVAEEAAPVTIVALAEEREGERAAPREGGDRPEGDRPRDGERPAGREGDQPRTGEREREGDRPREEAAPRDGDRPREGERPATEGRGVDDPLAGFRPQTERERMLFNMILKLRAELAAVRRSVMSRGGEREGGADGERPRTGPRDGEAPRTGPRDGEAPRTGPRDGDAPRTGPRDGDAPKTGSREGDAPVKPGPREGDAPAKKVPGEGDRG